MNLEIHSWITRTKSSQMSESVCSEFNILKGHKTSQDNRGGRLVALEGNCTDIFIALCEYSKLSTSTG